MSGFSKWILEQHTRSYMQVCQSWNGRSGAPKLTVAKGLSMLGPVIDQKLNPVLAERAKILMREIVKGHRPTNYDTTPMKKVVNIQ